jgi:dipeptidyl aminopeptidase/acylaminoacyl peptidase
MAVGCTSTSTSDEIAYFPVGSETVMALTVDGTSAKPMETAGSPGSTWPDQDLIIKLACANTTDVDIEVVSPDGASLGLLDATNWTPEISPVAPYVLVACAHVDGDRILLVSDTEVMGSREGWSRSGRAELSDQIDIKAIAMDGSELREVTHNQAGNWLPRWSPDGAAVVFESNRDGNSEIYYVINSSPRDLHRVTNSASPDLAPVWSRDGSFVAFTRRDMGQLEVWVAEPNMADPQPTGQHGRPVPWPR